MPDSLQCRPADLADSCPGPSAHGVDQISWATRARVPGTAGTTRCPARLGTGPGSLGVEQLCRATHIRVQGPAGSTSCPGRLALGSEGRPVRPAPPGLLRSGPMVLRVDQLSMASRTVPKGPGVEQLSQAPWTRVRMPKGSTSCPTRLGPGSEDPRGRPAVSGDSGQLRGPAGSTGCPGTLGSRSEGLGVQQLSRATHACVRGPPGSTSFPGCLRPRSRDSGIDPRSRAARAIARGPTMLTNAPRRLGHRPDILLARSAVPNDSRPCPRACGFDRLSRGTLARSEGLSGRAAVPWVSCPCPTDLGDDQLSRVTPARVQGPE